MEGPCQEELGWPSPRAQPDQVYFYPLGFLVRFRVYGLGVYESRAYEVFGFAGECSFSRGPFLFLRVQGSKYYLEPHGTWHENLAYGPT